MREPLGRGDYKPLGVNGITPGPEGLTNTPTTNKGAMVSPWRVYGTLEPEGFSTTPTTY